MTQIEYRPSHGNLPDHCHPKIREIVDYWLSIHPAFGLPGRLHLDPVDKPHLLSNMRLVEVHGPPYRFLNRLIGSEIVEFFEADHTGMWYDEVFDDFANRKIYGDFCHVLDNPEPNWRSGSHRNLTGKNYFQYERVIIPLASDGQTVDMLLMLQLFELREPAIMQRSEPSGSMRRNGS